MAEGNAIERNHCQYIALVTGEARVGLTIEFVLQLTPTCQVNAFSYLTR